MLAGIFGSRRIVVMEDNSYRELWFTLRGLARLIGVNRNSLAYRIGRLKEFGAIENYMYKNCAFRHKEGKRQVVRDIEIYNIFAARTVADTYDTIRAQSVVDRCNDIIRWNDDADYSKVKSRIID